jgi:hypothetical protein
MSFIQQIIDQGGVINYEKNHIYNLYADNFDIDN